jgi:subtilisin family serine protease
MGRGPHLDVVAIGPSRGLASIGLALILGWSCTQGAGPVTPVTDWALAAIGGPAAWAQSRGQGVTVAVIDSGVDDRRLPSMRQRDTGQYTWTGSGVDRNKPDSVGHGTAVASVIAESGDIGFFGVAPAVRILSIQVTTEGVGGDAADLAGAIRLAVLHGAAVINLSLGSFGPDAATTAAIAWADAKNVIIVAAAGDTASPAPLFPASLNNVIAVRAVDHDGNPGPRANPVGINGIGAPGINVPTITLNDIGRTPWVGVATGSSIAAAIVTGSVALLVSCSWARNHMIGRVAALAALRESAGGQYFFKLPQAMRLAGC